MREDHAFTSDLTVGEHHAIRSVGFSPVGQVLGSCVYQIGYTGSWYCGYTYSSNAMVTEASGIAESLYEARQLAMNRMVQECQGLGADGVVAVRLSIQPFPAGGLEFQAIGTAVRADGEVRPARPFTSDLSGQEFAKLMVAGWVPVSLVLGIAVLVRHDDYRTQRQRMSWVNQEMRGYTELVNKTRHTARQRLRADCARAGGKGVVLQEMDLQVGERPCRAGPGDDNHDHLVEATVIGTAIAPFRAKANTAPPAPLPMLRLNR
jgi:uncharacterized protein YbjQ (UPF0145 family)